MTNDPDNMRENETAAILQERFNPVQEKPKKLDMRFKANRALKEQIPAVLKTTTKSPEDVALFIEGMKIISTGREAKTQQDLRNCIPAATEFVNIIKEYRNQK